MNLTRKERLFAADKATKDDRMISTNVKFQTDKNKVMQPLAQDGKMLCAIRKALIKMGEGDGKSYYIASDKIQVMSRSSSPGARKGDPGSYAATGRFKLGCITPFGGATFMWVSFDIRYHDKKDNHGLPDVEYDEDSIIDELPRGVQFDAV